jgi:type II secretory ATPase GspE/PulE/Tfp pilus assembly ATPase PilB-like protein
MSTVGITQAPPKTSQQAATQTASPPLNAKPVRLGDALIDAGIITADQLEIALKEQKSSSLPLGQIIIKLGLATESIVRDALSKATGQASVELDKIIPDDDVLALVPKDFARHHRLLPVSIDPVKKELLVAMSDTFNVQALDRLRIQIKNQYKIHPVLASESEIEEAIDNFYGYSLNADAIVAEIESGNVQYSADLGTLSEYSHPLVRLVDAMLAEAVKRGASDVHFEPEEGFYRVRYRIDGVLRQVRALHTSYCSAITVRLKVLAGMNIAETRSPQDGRISLTISGRQIDFRVSAQPTVHGENIVLRILDKKKGIVPLENLGLAEDTMTELKIMMSRPEGIILVTGPTGSGKTTTLYSMINYMNSVEVNIMTLEDPVEYPMSMIRQSSVNEAAKLDFASGIRSLMRQDPDVILVGEIRDSETAEMALRAAMTGHQVYSTLHTNSAVRAIPRLLDLEIPPAILSGNIIGIIAQRLVRKLCKHCKEAYSPEDFERKLLGIKPGQHIRIFKAKGCKECDHSGYKGRLSLMEVLRIDPDLDELIARRATNQEITNMALEKGFIPIAEDGARRVLDGTTSLEEVSRVIDLTQRMQEALES